MVLTKQEFPADIHLGLVGEFSSSWCTWWLVWKLLDKSSDDVCTGEAALALLVKGGHLSHNQITLDQIEGKSVSKGVHRDQALSVINNSLVCEPVAVIDRLNEFSS